MDLRPRFTEEELFQVLRWTFDDESAAKAAHILSDTTPGPLQNGHGPGVPYRSMPSVGFSEGAVAMLSLLSEDSHARALQEIEEMHGGHLTQEERNAFEKMRAVLRAELVRQGKLPE